MQYICGKTGDEGNIYAARQGMRACNNNNMRNPSLHLFYCGVTHVIIVACPHSLSCCIYIALIPCLAAYILPSSPILPHIYCTCFSTFWHCHPYILQHFNGNAFTPFILVQCCLALPWSSDTGLQRVLHIAHTSFIL